MLIRNRCIATAWAALCLIVAVPSPLRAQVTITVNADSGIELPVMPDVGLGLHTSVYANIFGAAALPDRLAESGLQSIRYPGGNYASIYHWTSHTATGGYSANASHFGNFVTRLLEGAGAEGMVTINYGSSHQATLPGQPKEAAAWVAYANGDAGLFGTESDVEIGVDDEGNDWRTVGYWARLRSMTPAENTDNQYDFLAIDRDEPVGIKYWEIGNELNGNGYYSDININFNWQYDLNAPNPYGPGRGNHPGLSPTTYGNNFNEFAAAMKAVDPNIKVGAVLTGPNGVGDVGDPNRNWDANVLTTAGPNIDFGIYHWYPGGSNNVNTNTIQVLNASDDLPGIMNNIRGRLDTYVGPGASDEIEIHLTEIGYFGAELPQAINGVFAANSYIHALAAGATSVHWLELSDNSYLGDIASLNRGGAYYGIQTLSQIAVPGSEFIATSSSSGSMESRTMILPDGSVGMLITNVETTGDPRTVDVVINGVDLAESGTQWLFGASQTTPLEMSMATGLGNTFTVTVPIQSMVALLIDAAPPTLPGDYNGNGVVDAADYTVWRDSLGQAGADLSADGSGPAGTPDGVVDSWDYDFWKSRFGDMQSGAGGGAISASAVPEPASLSVALVAIMMSVLVRRQESPHR
jgi:hypothetical protein